MDKNKGFVKTVIIIVIALIVLGYYGFNLRQIVSAPAVSDNLSYAREVSANIWNSYLKTPVTSLLGWVKQSLPPSSDQN